jgi:outer membrane protein assembly factor BamD (BamD/ComL family)
MGSMILKCAPIVFLLSACALGRQTTTENEAADGASRSTSIGVHASAEKAALEKGRQQMREGKFDLAAATLEPLTRSSRAASDQQAQALLELGRIYVDVLNPDRDPEKARRYFQRLIDEFPDSELVPRAQEHLERIAISGK